MANLQLTDFDAACIIIPLSSHPSLFFPSCLFIVEKCSVLNWSSLRCLFSVSS